MSRVTLSKSTIDTLPIPESGRKYTYDSKVGALAICVSSTGSRVWYVYKFANGRPVRIRIGSYPDVPPAVARQEAVKMLAELANGGDPQERKRKARQESTLGDLWAV